MTQIKELLKLIENVDPTDNSVMDEIDARSLAYINNHVFESYQPSKYVECYVLMVSGIESGERTAYQDHIIPNYSNSIDAQEQIDTEGWDFYGGQVGKYAEYQANKWADLDCVEINSAVDIETECLARLHCKLQVVEYERENG